jgi:thiosulfate/3-mercaptopyruvate sulfurtransferase
VDYKTLIEPVELAKHIADPGWVVVDCRFELSNPTAGSRHYAEGHIPGARYANLDADLSGPVTASTGRHPLPAPERFARTLGAWGIDNSTQVVAYDDASGALAARLWWMLRWVGHRQVAVLNGGLKAWVDTGHPMSNRIPVVTPATFVPDVDSEATVTVDEVVNGLAAGTLMLVDARASDRFGGENEALDPVAGHVPGARNHPFASNLDVRGRFLPAAELRKKWHAVLGEQTAGEVASMCGSGVTACHNLLALEISGLRGARLYPGSWSEWIRDPERPVATR